MKSYDNFFLPVDDMESAIKYYSETLGLKVKFNFSDKGMVAFHVGDEEPAIILKDIKKFPEVKPTIWLVVDNGTAEYGELKSKGVNFLTEPFPIGTGTAVEFEDEFGNRLGITDYTK